MTFPAHALRLAQDDHSLADNDHITFVGDFRRAGEPVWFNVGELRAAAIYQERHMNPYESEDIYKATRLRDLQATRRALDAETTHEPHLATAEELKPYIPPNSYEIALRKLREAK